MLYQLLFYTLNAAKQFTWAFLNFGMSRAGVWYLIGRGCQRLGRRESAYRAFKMAEGSVKQRSGGKSRNIFKISQFCEFNRVYVGSQLGLETDREPLSLCQIVGIREGTVKDQTSCTGIFDIAFSHLGMRLDGVVSPSSTDHQYLELMLDDRLLRAIPLSSKKLLPPFFHFHVKREVLARFPKESTLVLRTVEGEGLVNRRCTKVEIRIPHGDGTIFSHLDAGGRIDKKGFLALTPDTIMERQARYLSIYAEARKFFKECSNSPLFIMYGTLLGLVREGDFIKGDDDFDAGYISLKTDSASVKAETMDLVVSLVLAGFNCSFNRNGRLFRLRLIDDKPDVHLDVRPVWYEEGHVWAHKQARLPLSIDDFLPVETRELRGVAVDIPRHAEAFLESYYGPGWKQPDPGYSNASQTVPRRVKRNLDSVCISPADYQVMQERIEARRGGHPRAGKLIATGLHSLYPLEEYEANCEW